MSHFNFKVAFVFVRPGKYSVGYLLKMGREEICRQRDDNNFYKTQSSFNDFLGRTLNKIVYRVEKFVQQARIQVIYDYMGD